MTNPIDIQPQSNLCSKCNTPLPIHVRHEVYSLVCGECGSIYYCFNDQLDLQIPNFKQLPISWRMNIGISGNLKGVNYQVIAMLQKAEAGTEYTWEEYTLWNPIHGIAYLSVYNGHWMLLNELNEIPLIEERNCTYQNENYELFANYETVIIQAFGEFFYPIDKVPNTTEQDFINRSGLITKEYSKENVSYFKGEYIVPAVIKKAFDLDSIPEKVGVGMIEPFMPSIDFGTLKNIVIGIVLIWGALQIYYASIASDEIIFNRSYTVTDSTTDKDIITPAFKLQNGTKNIELKVNVEIDNDWFYTGATLVNEKTGDLYDLEMEAEYYYGYEEGERWSEGNQYVAKIMSAIPEGNYYLILHPIKSSKVNSTFFTVTVCRDVYVFSNGIIILIVLLLFPIYYFIRSYYFEMMRWKNSDYSNYDE